MKNRIMLLGISFFFVFILCFSINAVAFEWHDSTFGASVTVEEPPSPSTFEWHDATFGVSITVEEPPSAGYMWLEESFGASIIVEGWNYGNWSDWWVLYGTNSSVASNPYPENNAQCVSCGSYAQINASNINGSDMDITWYSNSSGSWQIFGRNNSVYNGTYQQTNSNFSSCDTTYFWNVSIYDGNNTVNSDIYYFTTIRQPIINSVTPNDGSTGQERQTQVCVDVSDPCGGLFDIEWFVNSSGSWVLVQTDNSLSNGSHCYTYSSASMGLTKYYWRVNVSNSCCYVNNTYSFTTKDMFTEHSTSIRANDTGFFCYRGDNTTAANFSANITGFDESDEYISVWKNNTWNTADWMWVNYYGDDSGTDFTLNRFDVVRINLNDDDSTITVWMNDSLGICCCNPRNVDLTYGANRGYNYTCYCINVTETGNDTLSEVAAQSPLTTGESIAWWNESSYRWETWIVGVSPSAFDHTVSSYDVFETKVSTNRVWVIE